MIRICFSVGEPEAIASAQQLQADLIIMGDSKARRVAQERGLAVTGTLAVLATAAAHGLFDLPTAVYRLRQMTFRALTGPIQSLLDQDRGRKGQPKSD
jgi:predicted nucleic acid-binding protein